MNTEDDNSLRRSEGRGLTPEQTQSANRETNRIAIGMLLFTAVGILASSRHGFFGNFHHSSYAGLGFSLLAGAVAGLLMFPQYRIAALACCALAAACGYAALDYYLPGRESVNTVEIVLIQCVASIPAIIAGNLLRIFVYTKQPVAAHRDQTRDKKR